MEASQFECDTSLYYGYEQVSFGAANSVAVNNDVINFSENIIGALSGLQTKNLIYCRYLNIRHS